MSLKMFPLSLAIFFLLAWGLPAQSPTRQGERLTEWGTYDCTYDQCHATAKSTGKRCKHCVSGEGEKYCWQHKTD